MLSAALVSTGFRLASFFFRLLSTCVRIRFAWYRLVSSLAAVVLEIRGVQTAPFIESPSG